MTQDHHTLLASLLAFVVAVSSSLGAIAQGAEWTEKDLAKNVHRAEEAFEEELITVIPDDLDWNEEFRLSVEERTTFSPDALTGLEANLRFPGKETCETKIFGRLTAWQNWIFNRPNAVSEKGALKLFGTGSRAKFDNKRV